MHMTYAEKLRDPRWQRKRLQTLEAYNFKCGVCLSEEKTLHVHHLIYRKGVEPWDYEPVADLMAMCEDCHNDRTLEDARIKEALTDGVFRDVVRLLLEAGSYNSCHVYGGMLPHFYHALWCFLERFQGVPWRLAGELSESRINSQIKCLGWLKDAKNELCKAAHEAVLAYESAMLKFHEGAEK